MTVKQKTLSMLKSFVKLKLSLKRFHKNLSFSIVLFESIQLAAKRFKDYRSSKYEVESCVNNNTPLNWLSSFAIVLSNVIQGGHFSGIYRKVQLKPLKWVKVAKPNGEGEEERPVEALMVLKYGGVLTHAGRKQVLTYYFWVCLICYYLFNFFS